MDVPEEKFDIRCRITLGEETVKAKDAMKMHQARHNQHFKTKENSSVFFQQLKVDADHRSWFDKLSGELATNNVGRANTKLRTNKINKKKFRNMEGILSIQVSYEF